MKMITVTLSQDDAKKLIAEAYRNRLELESDEFSHIVIFHEDDILISFESIEKENCVG